MYKTTLEYWSPKDETVVSESGFRYRDMSPIMRSNKEITDESEIGLFEQFYKLNNSLRYCNGYSYRFVDHILELKYREWLKSDDFNKKSFNLYYGNGVVD